MSAGFQATHRFGHHVFKPGDPLIAPAFVAIPLTPHERHARRGVANHRIKEVVRRRLEDREAIALRYFPLTHRTCAKAHPPEQR
jgi:hypothetical protein